ncbi:MAG: hypothetical protein AUG48_01115 [Actinobacteria bacterium 13_1_20CM_3_68_9]|nr:MAG: hypothetical protein AUG48_01115 [Actinobacteria bacterium 13_1_20CM_3_68_9]
MAAARHPTDGANAGDPGALERFVRGGLALLELEATEAEMGVIGAVDALYRPLTDRLIAAELDGIEPEPGADMAQPPR